MSWVLSLEERGSGPAAAKLRRVASNAEHSERFFTQVRGILLAQSRHRWNTEPGWPVLEWATVKRKARSKNSATRRNAHQTLRATGALERALTVWGAPGQRWDTGPDWAVFGIKGGRSDAFTGWFHQTGRGVPKREVLKATRVTVKRVSQALHDHLFDGS